MGQRPRWSWQFLAAMLAVALFSSVLAYLFWNRGVAEVGANVAGLFVHLMPAFGIVLAWLFLGERMARVPRRGHRAHPHRHLDHEPLPAAARGRRRSAQCDVATPTRRRFRAALAPRPPRDGAVASARRMKRASLLKVERALERQLDDLRRSAARRAPVSGFYGEKAARDERLVERGRRRSGHRASRNADGGARRRDEHVAEDRRPRSSPSNGGRAGGEEVDERADAVDIRARVDAFEARRCARAPCTPACRAGVPAASARAARPG